MNTLQSSLRDAGFNAALLSYSKSLYYYTGTTQPSCLIITPDDFVLLVLKGMEHVEYESWLPAENVIEAEAGFKDVPGVLKKLGIDDGILGMEADVIAASFYLRMTRAFPQFKISDVSKVVLEQRKIKDERELEWLRQSGRIVHAGHERILNVLRVGMTEIELSAEIEDAHRRAGHEGQYFHRQFDFFMGRGVLASGEDLSRIAGKVQSISGMGLSPALPLGASARVIGRGDMIVVDIPTLYRGYHSDQSRTYVIGRAPAACHDLYQGMKEICDRTIEYLKPGVTCAEVYETALSVAREIGMEPYYLRLGGNPEILPFVGHGVGLEVNELPLLSRHNPDIIQEGVVTTIEIEMWKSEREVVKLEDTIVVHAEGAEILTLSPRELCEI
ncbi:MAG: Xaa-Pro peptidase family protein [Syntrophales bacterium LBB04]|nr:Xaa-Pro peptidase family protein [Syntrophales bacterium LBB04]